MLNCCKFTYLLLNIFTKLEIINNAQDIIEGVIFYLQYKFFSKLMIIIKLISNLYANQ